MNGRFFAGRKVEASIATGKLKFKRSGREGPEDGEDEEDETERQRLDDFAKWLEKGQD